MPPFVIAPPIATGGGGSVNLNPLTTIAASGAAQTLNAATGIDPVYDVTLTANCVFTLAATAGAVRQQTVTLWLRQDATAGRTASFGNVAWASGSAPQLNTSGGAYDVLQFATLDGVKWLGSVLALGVVAPALPAAPTLTVTPGNASNVLTFIDGAANGSPITSRKLYRGTVSGGETLLGTITLSTGSYTDTGLTNDTTYYYRASTVNAVGESPQSAEVSGKPTAIHYLRGGRASTPGAYAANTFADVEISLQISTFPGGDTPIFINGGGNSGFYVYLTADKKVQAVLFGSNGQTYPVSTSSLPDSILNKKFFIRAFINPTGADVTEGIGTWATRTATFAYSLDGSTYTSLGGGACGDTKASSNAIWQVGEASLARVFGAVARNAAGTVLLNPNFGAQPTGSAAFTDAVGNTWTLDSGASFA